ncbi:hypothetical protein BH11BAC3_BH11BAC3_33940 [soil metagenome]
MRTIKTLMTGVIVGAILGVLYAPEKGSITRRKLSRKGDDIRDKFNDLKDRINEKLEDFKEDVNDMAYQEMQRIESETAAPVYIK